MGSGLSFQCLSWLTGNLLHLGLCTFFSHCLRKLNWVTSPVNLKYKYNNTYLLHHKLINTPTSRSTTRYEHSALFIGKTPVWFSNSECQGLYLCCWHSQLNLLFIPFQSTFKLSTAWPVMSITVTWLKHDKVEASRRICDEAFLPTAFKSAVCTRLKYIPNHC